ncbi:hypothetical protein ASF00_09330 [Sphingomonas sp. Leaf34]|uniref:hypothetical protein n=1 Tax=Sphingomonas sp. Leaf34 TaxID=1736216 RepID=UPI0006F1F3D4|nr:hypothetical protein [Sphingomonas sp. Leaf34]KQN28100.1 hypothetical protein ASF00_09330 [Sphingomonas sp. Leaf34]
MDLELADSMAAVRGFTDWTGDDRAQALVNASDYIRTYRLRPTLTPPEQDTVNLATLLIAIDLLDNPAPALRSAPAVKRTEKQLGNLKTIAEYFEASNDPYPRITEMLAPLLVRAGAGGGGIYSGILFL